MTTVSVIVPVYQDQSGLTRCLRALEAQIFPKSKLQIIVVDNGSNPPIKIVSRDELNVELIRCMTPGSYAARNAGAKVAKGEILAFTDADCVPDPDWISAGVKALSSMERPTIIGGNVKFLPTNLRSGVSLYQTLVGFGQKDNIEKKMFSATANLFCYRSTFTRVGPFLEDLYSGGDREWAWRARRRGIPTKFCSEAVVATLPRSTLVSAIRQARRIVAGRRLLQRRLTGDHRSNLKPHRGALSSFFWVALHPELNLADRVRALCAASIIKSAAVFEIVRLAMGGRPERR